MFRYVILFVCYVGPLLAMKIPSALRQSLAASSVSFCTVFHSYNQPLSVEAVEPIAVRQEQKKIASKTFMEFLASMEKGEISRVVFKGVRPEYCVAFYLDGTIAAIREGFPAYDDPRSPSGPAQVIGLCQHTPGVTCEQDISDVLTLSKKLRGKVPTQNRPMLAHSKYPDSLKGPDGR
jgi:hypothetical protein